MCGNARAMRRSRPTTATSHWRASGLRTSTSTTGAHEGASLPTQRGGVGGRGADTAAHLSRAVWEWARGE
eukprot:1541205-Lingulodinium_polyedra.AAC.1